MDQVALIALGANEPSEAGPPEATVRAALAAIGALEGVTPRAESRFFRSAAFPAGAGPDYINATATFDCDLPPETLLVKLHAIEDRFGRTRQKRWASRSLDLDLLGIGKNVLPSRLTWRKWHDLSLAEQKTRAPGELILPHPRLHERAFVLVPLAEIAPDWRHPVLGHSVREMCESLPTQARESVVPL